MPHAFLNTLTSPAVRSARAANGGLELWDRIATRLFGDRFTGQEAQFIHSRDSFYIASVSENGWPYIQHRGGPSGFLRVLDEKTLGFLDFRGNKQYLTLGNTAVDDRVALFLMDYPSRTRLKILAHLQVLPISEMPLLTGHLRATGYKATAERAFRLTLKGFDWNCPQHITTRVTAEEIEAVARPLEERIVILEAQNRAFLSQLKQASKEPSP
jgi:uncharacterized protein